MAESSGRALFLRFIALSILGVAVDALLYALLDAALSPFFARALSLFSGLIAMGILLPRIDMTAGGRLAVGDAGIIAILTVAALLNYGLFAALLAFSPSLQPLAAMAFATVMSLSFGCFGYLRLLRSSD
ncbi:MULTISPECIES: GtrA family protein [unclassified Rhizobium]|uniref:GtrA family protein n=1 Tax=unclassified Rhizobium TaxID=2613769 RepID=UPI001676E84C|nr:MULTISPECIES: GtrA family protein [unclassified Rhizobium]